jgi:hypothetical protein
MRWEMEHATLCALMLVGCASSPVSSSLAQEMDFARGPWLEVPTVEMPTGDTSIPISLLQDAADALLKRPGAKVCDKVNQRPIVGLSTEYCSTLYVAGDHGSLSWRLTEPIRGDHESCSPFFVVKDNDHPSSQVWVVGYIHNHPCGTPPSSGDLRAWPTDAFDPYVAMAEVRLIPGNPVPVSYKETPIEMASAVIAERQDGSRIFLRYFPTGEIQQWSAVRTRWMTLGRCAPGGRGRSPQCDQPLRPLSK